MQEIRKALKEAVPWIVLAIMEFRLRKFLRQIGNDIYSADIQVFADYLSEIN